jgi:hypothetical protein
MPHTAFRVIPVEVDVTVSADGAVKITCTPDSAPVTKDTKHALITFTLNTTGYRFRDTDAITLDPDDDKSNAASENFPYQSWTLSDTQAALYDNNKSNKSFPYTVTVVNTTTGQEHSVDPEIHNGGGGTGVC